MSGSMAADDLAATKAKLTSAGISLSQEECKLLASDLPVTFSLKYGRATMAVPKLHRNNITTDFISAQVKQKWTELEELDLALYSDKDSKHEIDDVYLQACSYPLVVYVRTIQKGFSDFTPTDALNYAGVGEIALVKQDVFPAPVEIKDDNHRLIHVIEDLRMRHQLYDPLEEGCEYTRREFISPVLVLAALITGVKLACEEMVEGSTGKGPVDWVAHYQNHRIYITEGKKDNITQGLYQNLAQLTAAGEGRGSKRQFCVDLPLYGVATTYREWIFLRLDPLPLEGKEIRAAVRLDTMVIVPPTSSYFAQSVRDVAGHLAGILWSQKEIVDKESGNVSKKNKTED